MQHLQGGKFTTSHSTVISEAVGPAKAAAQLVCVKKVSLGLIQHIGKGKSGIRFSDEGPTCLLAKVRGVSYIQELRIYSSDLEQVRVAMQAAA